MASSRGQAEASVIPSKVRGVLAIAIIGLSLFAVVSTGSYAGMAAGAGTRGHGNLCGATGQALAEFMLFGFGYASYALYACLGIWGVVLLLRREVPAVGSKVVGLVFFTMFLAAFLSHLLKGSPSSIPDYGGLVGRFVDHFLTATLALGVVGARIILVALFLITLILATDWIFFTSLVAFGRWTRDKARQWNERTRQARAAAARPAAKGEPAHERAKAAKPGPAKPATEKPPGEKPPGEKPPGEQPPAPAAGLKKEKAVAALMKQEEEKLRQPAAGAAGPDDDKPPRSATEAATAATARPASSAQARPAAAEAARPGALEPADHGLGFQTASSAGVDLLAVEPPPPRKKRAYRKPSLDLLDEPEVVPRTELEKMVSETSALLESTLQSFKIDAEVVEIDRGPVITLFELELAPGIKVERLRALEDDIAMAVKAPRVRIVAPIPGKSTAGIEVPNAVRETVRLKEIFRSRKFRESKCAIPICLGKDASGNVVIDDLAKMPHLLVAGSTGSGKSVCLNSIIMSVLYTRDPQQVRFILVDPKMVELSAFKDIPHLMCPVVTEMKRAGGILEWACREMDSRYSLLHMAGVRNIYAYNKLGSEELRKRLGDLAADEGFQPVLPFVIIMVDELAELMMIGTREVEANITRLAQKSRAVGLHLVLATQRPSTNVITGLIKANMPTRIAFMVASKIDSRVILDVNGAEKLLGQGDMLYLPPHTSIVQRAQGTFVCDEEVRRVAAFLAEATEQEFDPELTGQGRADFDPAAVDDLYEQAVDFVLDTQRGSASLLQRHFSIGYTRASRLIDLMSQDGILGDFKGSQARDVSLTVEEWNERKQGRQEKNSLGSRRNRES